MGAGISEANPTDRALLRRRFFAVKTQGINTQCVYTAGSRRRVGIYCLRGGCEGGMIAITRLAIGTRFVREAFWFPK
jgi:hypothetical protein